MRKIKLFTAVAIILFVAAACNSKKTTTETAKNELILQDYPEMEGFKPQLISLKSAADSEALKVELIAGKTMEVDDCNSYGLQGEFEQLQVDATGAPYYVFNSNGEVIQTLMACPDDKMHTEFVSAQSIMADYNSEKPLVAYLPDGIELKHRVWKMSEMTTATFDSDEPLLKFIAAKNETYDTYVLQTNTATENAKIELIPGIVKEVDCNKHWLLTSDFVRTTFPENGYFYVVFESDGQFASTRMACPDGELTATFIHGDTITISFENEKPIVISVPKGFELRYRVWTPVEE